MQTSSEPLTAAAAAAAPRTYLLFFSITSQDKPHNFEEQRLDIVDHRVISFDIKFNSTEF